MKAFTAKELEALGNIREEDKIFSMDMLREVLNKGKESGDLEVDKESNPYTGFYKEVWEMGYDLSSEVYNLNVENQSIKNEKNELEKEVENLKIKNFREKQRIEDIKDGVESIQDPGIFLFGKKRKTYIDTIKRILELL